MARRRDGNVLNVLFDIAAAIPWWIDLGIAAVAYVIFHWIATTEVAIDPKDPMGHMLPSLLRGVSVGLQYIVPTTFVAGAVASLINRKKRLSLVNDATLNPESIRAMPWQDFEILVGQAFRNEGYRVVERGGSGPDGGVDLVLDKGGLYYLVQCKHWRAAKVSVSVVRELQGVIATVNAAGGLVVTSGDFTQDARRFAQEANITLIDGKALSGMFTRARSGVAESPYNHVLFQKDEDAAACPRCGSEMVQRKARRGDRAGQAFLGCSRYPDCRGIRNL